MARTRLNTEQRRAQLLAIGAEVFGRQPYEQVSVEEIAQLAEVSTGLLYHYFPSKWAFFSAVAEHEGAKLVEISTPDPTLSPFDRISAGLWVYIAYAEQHPGSFRMSQQSAFLDPERRQMLQTRVTAQRDRILATLAEVAVMDDRIRIAATGWLAFVQTAIVEWLDNPAITRDELHDLCARTLWAAVHVEPGDDAAPGR